MGEQLSQALTILMVGMTTVFFILSIVVVVGNTMIRLLNSSQFVLNKKESASDIPNEVGLALNKAISKWSDGKAIITKITKN